MLSCGSRHPFFFCCPATALNWAEVSKKRIVSGFLIRISCLQPLVLWEKRKSASSSKYDAATPVVCVQEHKFLAKMDTRPRWAVWASVMLSCGRHPFYFCCLSLNWAEVSKKRIISDFWIRISCFQALFFWEKRKSASTSKYDAATPVVCIQEHKFLAKMDTRLR